MIVDKIENFEQYCSLSPRIGRALAYLKNTDLISLKTGRTNIEGDEIFINRVSTMTKKLSDTAWESHRKYMDIHFTLVGEELLGYSPESEMKPKGDYDTTNDFQLHEGKEEFMVESQTGTFVIHFPNEVHKPLVAKDDNPKPIEKVIVKVLF